jgi:hypothetical protein
MSNGAVFDHIQHLLAAPEMVARTFAAAKREGGDEITEREVTVLLADFARICGQGKLDIDLYGDLAGIFTLAAKDRPLETSDPSVQQDKVVAGGGFEPATFRS